MGSFDESIYTRKTSKIESEQDQSNLFENFVNFNNK